MDMGEDKDKLIRGVYDDPMMVFGSINATYKQAHDIRNTITTNDVKESVNKQSSRQTKSYRGFNSYVAKEPLHEIQIDLAMFTDSAPDNNGYKYVFVAVDVCSRKSWAVHIKDKKPEESVKAMNQIFEKIGVPETLYHDNGGSWSSTQFIRLIIHIILNIVLHPHHHRSPNELCRPSNI